MTKEEFRGWKNHPVTETFMQELSKDLEGWTAQLATDHTGNTLQDQYKRGVIRALITVIEWEPEDKDEA